MVYDLNGSGAITKETEGDRVEIHEYKGQRLDFVEHADKTRSTYSYDDFGNVTKIETPGQPAAEYRFDEFERMIGGHDAGQPDETFTYDGLDRRDSQTENDQAWDLSYIGTGEQLSQEQAKTAVGTEVETRTYDYDASMDGLGQSVRKPLTAASYKSYTKDANGSVTGLEDGKGHVKTGTEIGGDGESERYKYDPYGDSTNETSLTPGAKANPLRFEGFYYDAGLKTYDMRARVYRPDVGRFLTQDRYEAAAADLNLQVDPMTHNRYAFAGGNPVSNVEWDGHRSGRPAYDIWTTFHDRGGREVVLRWGRARAKRRPNRGPFGYRHIKDANRPKKGKYRNPRPGWSDQYLSRFISRVLIAGTGRCHGENCEQRIYTRQRVLGSRQVSRNRFIWTISIDVVIVGLTPEGRHRKPIGILTAYRGQPFEVEKTRACGCY